MRFSFAIALVSCLSVVLAAAVDNQPDTSPPTPSRSSVTPSVGHGTLAVYKKSLKGQRVPLTLNGTMLVLQGTSGSKKPQAQFDIIPCNWEFKNKGAKDNTAVFAGSGASAPYNTGGKLLVNGHIRTADGKCLARDPKSTAVKAVVCGNTDDKSQGAQFWTISVTPDGSGGYTANSASLDMVVKYFHHLYGGIVHASVSKPPSKWILTFSGASPK
ncbi:hypothetical protein BKA62DRAFT_834923 [Auriculariales sp. MPI-PUGE-AT-0066]|nr:hypothetical protein BKA62DRAFT_834923 [Auriculariales sp. MPI-PUGE-AT-0066]